MFSLLLKKALPFTLTLVVGVAVGTLFKSNSRVRTWMEDSTPMLGGRHEHYHSCPMGRRYLVAETKPLAILNVPDARWPRGVEEQRSDFDPVRVLVRFGANGKVGEVTALESRFDETLPNHATPIREAVERAARQIQFEPETINSIPVSVTKEVEIHFVND